MASVPTVVIIGAGIAGLSCAHHLLAGLPQDSARVTILEARDRIGGRLHSIKLGEQVTVDEGASWLHGIKSNPLTQLAPILGFKLGPIDNVHTKQHVTYAFDVVTGKDVSDLYRKIEDLCWSMSRRVDLESAKIDQRKKERREVKDEPVSAVYERFLAPAREKFMAEHKINRATFDRLIATAQTGIEGYHAVNQTERSFLWSWDEHEEDEVGGDRFVTNGYDRLTEYLSKHPVTKQPLDIRLGHTVTEIKVDKTKEKDAITVVTDKGPFLADYVVVTVPLGILKANRIRFDPPLPASKQRAISSLGFGVLDKVYLRFSEAFWPAEVGQWLCAVQDRPQKARLFPWFLNGLRYWPKEPALVAFLSADAAEEMEGWADDQKVFDAALDVLGAHFGRERVRKAFLGGYVTRWRRDPYTLGSYVHVPVGASAADMDELGRSVGNIHFAGEHVSRKWPGAASGAFDTGRREARKLRQKIRGAAQKQKKSQQQKK